MCRVAHKPGVRSGTLGFRLLIEYGKQLMLIGRIRGFEHELRPGSERSGSPFRERLNIVAATALVDVLVAGAVAGGSRSELARLHHASAGRVSVWQSPAEARAWLRRAIISGQVAVFRRVPPMRTMGHGAYAEMLGIDRGTIDHAAMNSMPSSIAAVTVPGAAKPVIVPVFAGTGQSVGLISDTSDLCPSPTWRSESVKTCAPEVLRWFALKEVPVERQDNILGHTDGGGFQSTTTRVRRLEKGTVLYRYVNDPLEPWGGWWFLAPLQGDPRVYAALPDYSTAHSMVKGKLKKTIRALYGIGAPRCSNKPGGPDQVYIAWVDYDYGPGHGNVITFV